MKTTNCPHRIPLLSFSPFPLCLLAIVLLGATGPAARAAEDLSTILQRGLFEEEANHDLPAAIKAYEAVVAATDVQRKLAGTALFRLAECHRKLGRTNDAVAFYQRVLREYPDQTRLADLSQQYVAKTAPTELGRDIGTERMRLLEREFLDSQTEYARLFALYRSLTNLSPSELKKALPTAAPDPLLTSLQEQRAKAEQRIAELGQKFSPAAPEMKSAYVSLNTIDKQIEERLDAIVAGIAVKVTIAKDQLEQSAKAFEQARAGAGTPSLSQSARAEQKRLLEEEIKIVEKDLAGLEQHLKAGIGSAGAISTKQRELLALRRQIAALGVETVGEASRLATSAPTDEEDKEVRRIQALIKDSPDLINAGGQNGATPLHTAASKGQLVVARFLLENKANVNARNRTSETPLHEAVRGGHKSMTELLLANGADVNAVGSGGTPLHYTASRGYKAIVEVLLANKANPNALNENQSTPLHVALNSGYDSVAELLLQAGADVNTVEKYPGMPGNPDSYSHSIGTPLHIAISSGKKLLAEKILARGADVSLRNQFGDTPLHLVGNRVELAVLLVAAKADVNARIREEGNELSRTPLALAVTGGHADMVEFLLKNGADPNSRFGHARHADYQQTPLTAAVDRSNPNERIVRALLEHKADMDARKGNGLAPLHLALYNANKDVVELLLKRGADVEVRDRNGGNTPLCMVWGGKEKIELLLDHKANPNAQNSAGDTPMHQLASQARGNEPVNNQVEIAELLIARGADVNRRNYQGLTPLNLFGVPARPGTPSGVELVEVLRKHGAKDEQMDIMADADSIRVWRKGMTVGRVVFVRDEAGRNRYTLIEALMNFYSMRQTPLTMAPRATVQPNAPRTAPPTAPGGIPQRNPAYGGSPATPAYAAGGVPAVGVAHGTVTAFGGAPVTSYEPPSEIPFPDLTRIRILRMEDGAKGEKKVISVNLINAAGIMLCANDVLLEFGDIIEIPEREYRLDEGRIGLSGDQHKQLSGCMLRKAQVVVKGQSTEVQLLPQNNIAYLGPVMRSSQVRNVLRSTSDLSRLRITRHADPALGQAAGELTIDLEAFQRSGKQIWDDLWLRGGDIIEVPERE